MITEWLMKKSEILEDKALENLSKADEQEGFKKVCTTSAGVIEAFAAGVLESIPDACIWGYTGLIALGFIMGIKNKK